MARGGAGSVWEGKREGGADGWAKRKEKEAVLTHSIWIGSEIWRGVEPPLGRRTPPYPPLILGSGAGLGQKRFSRVFEFLPPV